jgi:GNAT superfamily N-acetyltransferase
MGPIEGRPGLSSIMTADIPAGLALVSEAGWNQTAADWRFMLAAGRGRGLRDDSGRLIASSIVLPYRPGVGWVGMVLVGAAYRKRGHATRLIEDAVAYCRTAGLVPMLDATPPGREVYRRLGFADGETIERWRGQGGGGTVAAGVTDVERAIELDRAAFGADRSALIVDLAQRAGAPFLSFAGGTLLGRRGRTATQLGPLLASERATALTLCERAIDAAHGPVLLDIPARETALRQLLESRGFALERSFTRMSLGAPVALGETMRAIAGPELG